MLGAGIKYGRLNECTGIELQLVSDAECLIRSCSVSLHKDQLDIGEKKELSGALPDLARTLSSDSPVAITISGKGILTKQSPRLEHITTDSLSHVFPNIKPEQFYIQNFITGEFSYVSVIRREIVDTVLENFSASGIRVLMASLGVFPVSAVLRQINSYGSGLVFDGHRINYNQEYVWEGYSYKHGLNSEFTIKIDSEVIQDKYLLPYAAAFQLLFDNAIDIINIPVERVKNALSEYKEERKFKARLSLVLASFFLLLLLNFLVFYHYESANKALASEVSQSSAGVENIQKLRTELTAKEALIKQLGWYRGLSYAWICDQIAQTVPPTILLEKLDVNSLNKKLSMQKRKEMYNTGRISINATTTDLDDVNEWIYRLKEKSWVRQVVLSNYKPSQDAGLQEFVIEVRY